MGKVDQFTRIVLITALKEVYEEDEEVEARKEEYTYENGIIYGIGIGMLVCCLLMALLRLLFNH